MAEVMKDLEKMLTDLDNASDKFGPYINVSKTNIMSNTKNDARTIALNYLVSEYIYLG